MTNDWDIANTYFHYNLPTTQISEKDIEETVKHLNETVYNYFKYNFGLVDYAKEGEGNFPEMYKNFTKHQLKKKIKTIKKRKKSIRFTGCGKIRNAGTRNNGIQTKNPE